MYGGAGRGHGRPKVFCYIWFFRIEHILEYLFYFFIFVLFN